MYDSSPSISIIVPVFNVEQYLKDALDSLVHQKIPANEIIVIDDGSTDGSADILRKYSKVKPLKIFRTSNNGLGSARNFGRVFAKSEYIYFFDSDDLLDKHFTARMHQIINEYDKPDLIIFEANTFYDGEIDSNFSPTYKRTISGVFESDGRLITELQNHKEAYPNCFLYLSKNEMWAKNRLAFPPSQHEDEAVLFPLLALSRKTVVISEAYPQRRVRPGSVMTSRPDSLNVSGVLRSINQTKEFMALRPALVKPEIGAWRSRLETLCIRYLALCRETGVSISWAVIIICLIETKSVKHLVRIVFVCLPEPIRYLVKIAVNRD